MFPGYWTIASSRYNVTDVNGISSMNQSYVVEEIGKMETKVRAYLNEAGQFQCG